MIPLLDRTTETAAMVGSVNLIFRDGDALVGDNTEGKGIVAALGKALDPAGKRVVLLGAAVSPRPWPSNWRPPKSPASLSSIAPKPGPSSWPHDWRARSSRRL